MLALLFGALFGASPALAVECWTGWGYVVEAGSHAFKSERFLIVTAGPVAWSAGYPVELHVLDDRTGGRREDLAPLTVVPANPRFSRQQGLDYVNGIAAIVGSADQLAFGLSHIRPSVSGIERLDAFYRQACGLD
ncbi:MAG: hypothetical protein MI920_04175 [Kiloniellales bacterium]|nr:hypothetical protein [Kiloniellales bacterium]